MEHQAIRRTLDSKMRIYKTCVRPILIYETSKDEKSTKDNRNENIEGNKRINWRDRVNNEQIRHNCSIQDMARWNRIKRRCWKDHHMEKMGPERLAKWIGTQTLQYSSGRPRRLSKSWTSASQRSSSKTGFKLY